MNRAADKPKLVVKKPQLTPWQLFLKEYGESDG